MFVKLICLALFTNLNCYSNNNNEFKIVQSDIKKIFNHNQTSIKSIKIHKTEQELSDPIIDLSTDQTITLSFDDLSDEGHSFSYTIIHCDKDWRISKLSLFDYLDGFEFNIVSSSENSLGTTVPYTHYKLQLPNENTKLKISGNYIIRIVDTYDYSKIYFDARFSVVEQLVTINASIVQPIYGDKRSTSQQLNLSVNLNSLQGVNAENEIFTQIYQNNQQYNSIRNLKPAFAIINEINYSSPEGLVFNGGNEYRNFDTKSLRYNSQEIDNIIQNMDGFNIMLKPDEVNRSIKYSNTTDINGKYLVKNDGAENSTVEADYLWVYFTLPYYSELPNKDVYVFGALSDWECNPEYKMNYNFQRAAYELRLQLKQGFYNYRYVVKDIQTGETDHHFFEGSHFDTENSYQIFVYYRQPGIKYDRLVGTKELNSRRKE